MTATFEGDQVETVTMPVPDPTLTLPAVQDEETATAGAAIPSEPEPDTEILPAAAPAGDVPDQSAALAATVAARIEEVSKEIAADLDRWSQAEVAFLIEADADIASARRSCAEYATGAAQGISGRLSDASGVIGEMCSRYGRRAAAA